MRAFKMIAFAAIAVPAMALAQIGPNPSANGSLDPTIGRTGDAATAPADAPVGQDRADPTPPPAMPAGPEGDATAPAADTPPMANSTADAPIDTTTAPKSESKRKPR